ncbi:MAG: glycosyltransferase family 39 protein [Anaerolineae bacterium]|nr:glycosyltransferase family 39 protein [Anaerolineae bacterium]
MGSSILDGQIPYRDVWDHKPPAIFYLNALGLMIGNGSVWGVWFIQCLALAAAIYTEFMLLRRAFGDSVAILGVSLFVSSTLRWPAGDITNIVEFYALPIQFAVIFLFCYSETTIYRWSRSVSLSALGIGVAFLFFLRQNLVGIGVAIILHQTLGAVLSRQWRDYVRKQVPFWGGFSTTTVIVFGYFYAVGALDFFGDAAFRYNFSYSTVNVTLGMRLTSLFQGISLLSTTGLTWLMITGWCLAIFFLLKSQRQLTVFEGRLISIGCLGLPIEVLLTSLSGRTYSHYFLAWLPIASIMATFVLRVLLSPNQDNKSSFSSVPKKVKKVLSACLIIGMVTPPLAQRYFEVTRHILDNSSPPSPVISFIRNNTEEGDYVLMWGAETVYNFLAERQSPTRFVYQYPLYMKGYQSEEQINEFFNDLIRNCPNLIIDSSPSNNSIPPLDPQARANWESWAYQSLPGMEQVFQFIETHYVLDETVEGRDTEWPVYVLKENEANRCPMD